MDASEQAALPGSMNLEFIEELYLDYLRDESSVSPEWRAFFAAQRNGDGDPSAMRLGPSFRARSVFNPASGGANGSAPGSVDAAEVLQERVDQLVRAYRERGHLEAQLDPLGMERPRCIELDPAFHGLSDAHLDMRFSTENIGGRSKADKLSLREIIDLLRNTYCRSIGVEFMHIHDVDVRQWLRDRMEGTQNRLELTRDQQHRILGKLTEAVVLEDFIQKKFLGHKRFSLEGGESLMPLLQLALEKAADQGVEHIVMGMAHRGRLDVLANIIGMQPREIFREFTGTNPEYRYRHGDVKYHLGYRSEWQDGSGRSLHVNLNFNPSHLEYVDPVVQGRVRAIQDRTQDTERTRSLCLVIHGDAAFAGEGIIQETLNLADLRAYTVGGTIHVVINNQIGFTTDPSDARSSTYCTGVAKMLQSPIFHVNGEDPEAVAQVIQLCMDFRAAYKRDAFIDMYCYRRWGHNETDPPEFTQPLMYAAIKQRKSVRDSYLDYLIKLGGGITKAEADALAAQQREFLEAEYLEAQRTPELVMEDPVVRYEQFHGGPEAHAEDVDTGVEVEQLQYLLDKLTQVPADFAVAPRLIGKEGLLTLRKRMAAGEEPLNWGAAEALAFATLAVEGHRVRMTGQDVERGTFAHRHSVLHDHKTGAKYIPLKHLAADQAPVEIYNSALSEAGVLGFEYGYSVDSLRGLTVWEAQFGDFANAAQVIIDQFIASAEDKWKYLSGLVMLLPHSFDGIGPEHSSARLERFLTLAASDNMQVCNVTTPAQIFHLLRRQVKRDWRKPLIVMSPKGLLRHPEAVSSLDELAMGRFQPILPDARQRNAKQVSQVILCSGKVYYELVAARRELKRDDVAILRLEQLYPLRAELLRKMLEPYKPGTPVVWVQEEPENMGAWRYLLVRFGYDLFGRHPLSCVSRAASPSPATGSTKVHEIEQKRIMEQAFGADLPDDGALRMTSITKGFMT